MSDARQVMAKRFENCRALCALREAVLVRSTDDHDRPTYVLSRGPLVKTFPTLDSLEQWLERAASDQVAA